jgi:hypothetical protein
LGWDENIFKIVCRASGLNGKQAVEFYCLFAFERLFPKTGLCSGLNSKYAVEFVTKCKKKSIAARALTT